MINEQPTFDLLFYTVGYEGQTIESFSEWLRRRHVKRVLDVRANAISRKPGFSKTKLAEHLARLNIEYRHFPKLGITTKYRKQYTDRLELLDFYENELLPAVPAELERAGELFREPGTVLMCYEANPLQCHRSRLVKWIEHANH